MKHSVLIGGVAAAALAGLLFGFDTAVIAGVTGQLRALFHLTPQGLGWTVSAALWGTLLGALTAGVPGDRYGSRNGLSVMAALYLVSSLGCALAWSWPSLMVFRFIAGVGIGGSSVLAPVYISEIAPPARRGALVGMFQVNIVLGILVAYLSNFLIGGLGLGAEEWRWKLGVTALPALLLFAMLRIAPQSPRWLAAKGRLAEAAAVLARLGSPETVDSLTASPAPGEAGRRLSWRGLRKPILLAVILAVFNQFTGINAILYYSNDIFAAAGFGKVSADIQTVIVGLTNLVFTLLAMSVIDRLGRKTLLLIGSVGMAVSLAAAAYILSTGQHPGLLLWGLVLFIAAFAFSQGAVIWVYISEIFPTAFRARGQGLGSSAHWLMNALISGAFPVIAAWSRGGPFVLFAGMMVLQFVVVLVFYPETKGVALEDMAARLDDRSGRARA